MTSPDPINETAAALTALGASPCSKIEENA